MDWSKAKTILIISLVIVNIILGLAVFNSNHDIDTSVSEDFIEDSMRLLNNKSILVDAEIPRDTPSLEGLTVEYETFKTSELNHKFLSDEGKVSIKGQGLVEILTDNEKLTLLNEKLIIFESNQTEEEHQISTNDDAIDIATSFLIGVGYDTIDMKVSYIKEDQGRYYLEFSKIYNDRYLESAFTNIQLDSTGIKKFERLWLNVIEVGDTPIFISNAPKSILGLLSMNEVYGKTIQDISLCHYFNPEKHEYIQDPLDAQQGRAKIGRAHV